MKLNYNKIITLGAIVALTGFIMSGPGGFLIVTLLKPQPAWVSPAVFVAHYHAVQTLPFYFGFLLVGGMLMLAAGHYLNYTKEDNETKFRLLLSVAWTTAFAALIFFNYICQTTYVHNLALHYTPKYDAAISTFSMSNPLSLCWAIEMWGYAFLGVATWLAAGYYRHQNHTIRRLLVLNGIVSLLSAAYTVINVNWVLTTAGLMAYFVWNVLMITLLILIYRFHARIKGDDKMKRNSIGQMATYEGQPA